MKTQNSNDDPVSLSGSRTKGPENGGPPEDEGEQKKKRRGRFAVPRIKELRQQPTL